MSGEAICATLTYGMRCVYRAMGDWFGLKTKIDELLWRPSAAPRPRWQDRGVAALRVVYVLVRDFADGDLNQRAMSLVYTTLLSIVPLIAISFSVLKGFGVHNQIEPMLLGVLEPLGEQRAEITNRIIDFVDNVNVGVLGSVGLGILVFTVISLMQKIERAFNHIWYVSRARSFARRFSDYVSVIVVGPLLIFASTGLTAMVSSHAAIQWLVGVPGTGFLIDWGGRLIPYLLAVGAFTFIYVFMPNTRVRIASAFIGALVAAFLWKGMGWAFATFVAGSGKYTALYSVFATLVLFMIWLYLGWMILFIGSSIAFYHQNPEYLRIRRGRFRMSGRLSERLALHIAFRVATSFQSNRAPWTAAGLAQALNVPTLAVERVLDELESGGILVRTADDPSAYLPARPLDQIFVLDVLTADRERGERSDLAVEALPAESAVDHTVEMIDRAVSNAVHGVTLKDLATADVSFAVEAMPGQGPESMGGDEERGRKHA